MANIPTIAKLIGEGRCWRNGNYDLNYRSFKKKYVVDSHFIVLDFDAVKRTPKQMCNIMEPNFWYYTLSQGVKPGNNFRMVWVLTEAIGPQDFAFVYEWFLKKFPLADRNVKDISRMWYGGNGIYKVLSSDLTDISDILELRRSGQGLRPSPPTAIEGYAHKVEVGPH